MPNVYTSTASTHRVTLGALLSVLVLALALRLWGITFGLPYTYHPDEYIFIHSAQSIFKTGDLNPRFFEYPSLFFYLNALAYIPYYAIGYLAGVFHSPADIPEPLTLTMGVGYAPMPSVILLGRALTTLFGCLSVLFVFWIGLRLTRRPGVGLFAAVLMSISPTNVAQSRYVTPDTFLTTFILFAFLGAVFVLQRGALRDYALAGLGFGLVVSTKYNGLVILVALLVAHGLRFPRSFFNRSFWLALGVSLLTFVCTTPFFILDFPTIAQGFMAKIQHYGGGHTGMEGNALGWYLAYLWRVEGPLSLVALTVMVGSVVKRSPVWFLVSVFPAVYFVFISLFVVRNDRTLMPVTPFLFVLAAYGTVTVFDKLKTMSPSLRWIGGGVAILIGGLCLAIPTSQTVLAATRLTTVDSRETARSWINQQVPPGARIAFEAYSPFVDPQKFTALPVGRMIDHDLQWYIDQQVEYLVFSQGMFRRFYADPVRYAQQVEAYDQFFNQLQLLHVFTDGGYEIRIYRTTPQTH